MLTRRLLLATTLAALPVAGGCATRAVGSVRTFPLSSLAQASRRKVTADRVVESGREALRVSLEPGLAREESTDKPTFVVVPLTMTNGVIEVDVLARLLPDAPAEARAFVGLAYRISPAADRFEAVYLRPLNGRGLQPPPPRDRRAVQYFAYPDWPFSRLREEHPDGAFEAGAHIGPNAWINLRLEIEGRRVVTFVDGQRALTVEGKVEPVGGAVGLWVDIGTEAFFSNLRVSA